MMQQYLLCVMQSIYSILFPQYEQKMKEDVEDVEVEKVKESQEIKKSMSDVVDVVDVVDLVDVVIFDIDQVILQSNFTPVLWKYKSSLFYYFLNPWFTFQVLKEAYHDVGCLEKWSSFFHQYQKQELVEMTWQLADCKTVMPETIEIIKKLHINGNKLLWGTNMSAMELSTRHLTNAAKSHVFETYFEGGLAVSYDESNKDHLVKKPQLEYYHELIQLANQGTFRPGRIFFVDDKFENVLAAGKVGMIGIHFTLASRLEQDLHLHGLL
jgi:FMN phosphatase YigB (HAD superfamily)